MTLQFRSWYLPKEQKANAKTIFTPHVHSLILKIEAEIEAAQVSVDS